MKAYPDGHIVKLEQNYRSTKKIVQAANNLISHNTKRMDKHLFTENKKGKLVAITRYFDSEKECEEICNQIKKLHEEKYV